MAFTTLNLVNIVRRLAEFLPEVKSPTSTIPLRQKVVYTAVSLAVFLVGSHLLLYWTGVHRTPESVAANPLYWTHGDDASNSNTVMALGVLPLLASEAVVHMLLHAKIAVTAGNDAPQDLAMLLNRAHKLLAILITFGIIIIYMLSTATTYSTMDTILITIQLFLGEVIIIYLDEVLRKGYGLVSGIPLFTTANICANIFWKAFSPYISIESYGEQRGDLHRGDVVSSIFHRLFSAGDDEVSAMCKALRHQELPDVAGMVATYVFFLIVLSLQGFHVVLPLRQPGAPMLQANYTIRLSYLSFVPLVFQVDSFLYSVPQFLYRNFGENNKIVVFDMLGKWKESMYFRQAVPVSGIAYYATTPPTLADVLRDPYYTFLYAVLLLMGCALLSTSFFLLCAYSDSYVTRLLGEQRRLVLAQPDSVPHNKWRLYVAKVAFLVGLCIGTLKLLAGLTGVIGSGTGIMLAVTIIYSSLEGRGRTGAFGL